MLYMQLNAKVLGKHVLGQIKPKRYFMSCFTNFPKMNNYVGCLIFGKITNNMNRNVLHLYCVLYGDYPRELRVQGKLNPSWGANQSQWTSKCTHTQSGNPQKNREQSKRADAIFEPASLEV